MPSVPKVLVFADLDDTLFTPQAIAHGAATRDALNRVAHERIPLVFCSNKTRAELELIHRELCLTQPFICESGAAVVVPRGYFGFNVPQARDVAGYEVAEFGGPYSKVVGSLHRASERAGIQVLGFNDMSVAEVANECDLPLLHARLAKLREYNEPFRIVDAPPGATSRLFRALRGEGLGYISRGRYYHAGMIRQDVGERFLCDLYRREFGEVMTIAFGDHSSAAPLLRQADVPLVVQDGVSKETTRLLTDVPMARLCAVNSIGAWAAEILDIANATPHDLNRCSS
jgi:mannosyl-3-phosphoglycerate phosphatase